MYFVILIIHFTLTVVIHMFDVLERDAFDTLFDHAPDKLIVVKKVRKRKRSSSPFMFQDTLYNEP